MAKVLEIRSVEDDRSLLLEVLSEHWVMSLATSGSDGPNNTPVFYAVADQGEKLLFMSRKTTKHVGDIERSPRVASSIFLETDQIGVMRGVQIRGAAYCPREDERARLQKIYYLTHALARAVKILDDAVSLYAVDVHTALLVDNRRGFGRRILWDFRATTQTQNSGGCGECSCET